MTFHFNALEVFEIAIEIEENGRSFYERSQSLFGDSEVKELFSELAQQEMEHKTRFEMLKADLPPEAATPTVWDPDNDLSQYIKLTADQHVFARSANAEERLAKVKNVHDAVKLAIEFEKDSILFFLTLQEATYGKKAQDLINILIKEEREHLKRLAIQLVRLAR